MYNQIVEENIFKILKNDYLNICIDQKVVNDNLITIKYNGITIIYDHKKIDLFQIVIDFLLLTNNKKHAKNILNNNCFKNKEYNKKKNTFIKEIYIDEKLIKKNYYESIENKLKYYY